VLRASEAPRELKDLKEYKVFQELQDLKDQQGLQVHRGLQVKLVQWELRVMSGVLYII
jgi:hypothetical protein